MISKTVMAIGIRCILVMFGLSVWFTSVQGAAAVQGNQSSRRVIDADSPRNEFSARQRMVERKMVELEGQLTLIADRIREKNPKKADRLINAYQESREKLITKKMAEVGRLLDQNKLPQAEETLDEVVQNLERLIRLLVNEKAPEVTKQEEIEALEKIKRDIQERVREQERQRQEVAKIDDKDAAAKKLAAQIEKLNGLIDDQKRAIDAAQKNRQGGLRALDRVADQQFKIRKETEGLAKELAESSDEKNKDEKTTDGDAKSGEPKDGKPSGGSPTDGKSGQGKAGKSQGGSPGETSNQGKDDQSKAPQPGQQALEKAAQQQRNAEEKLGSARADEARQSQEKALENLEKALSELKKEKRRIESLPPDAIKDMARRQRRTRDKAMEIVKKMNDAPRSKSENGDDSQSQPPQQTPGQEPMEQAGQSMKKAADQMDQGDSNQAKKQQKKAQKEMEQALDEIEERLNQLREETREEKLARLEARFKEMYERQKVATAMTIELDDKRLNLGAMNRRDQLLILRVGTDEQQISEFAQQAYDLMLEDGTSVVFPEAVQDLRTDLQQVAELLFEDKTDRFTQLLQKEIEAAILDLLDALQEAKNQKEGGGGGGGGGGKQPLLKKSAELKILRRQQQRLNRRTRRVQQLRGSEVADETLDHEVQKAAENQVKLLEMTERLMEKE